MKRNVALIVETSSVYGRNLLSGIVRYMRMHDDWSVFLEQRDLWKQPPSWLSNWRGDGIISRATTPKLVDAISQTEVPLVEVTDRRGDSDLPQVRSDDIAIGRVGAEYLVERGFERFGFCGFKGESWSQRREKAFVDLVQNKTGLECFRFNSTWHGPRAKPWVAEKESIANWLKQIEPPMAIMTCNDLRGQQVIDSCLHLDLAVPEQVAVLGVDNDDLLCRVCTPPLSSIIPNAELVGFKAAEMLDSMMKKKSIRQPKQLIEPLGIATRQSTDVVAIEDKAIASALQYIREKACRGLTVNDVVNYSQISRSTLERQLRKYLGRSPQEEIRNVQIKRVQELLRTTELTAEQIAPLCGFQHPEYLFVVFKRITGLTVGQYRNGTNR